MQIGAGHSVGMYTPGVSMLRGLTGVCIVGGRGHVVGQASDRLSKGNYLISLSNNSHL